MVSPNSRQRAHGQELPELRHLPVIEALAHDGEAGPRRFARLDPAVPVRGMPSSHRTTTKSWKNIVSRLRSPVRSTRPVCSTSSTILSWYCRTAASANCAVFCPRTYERAFAWRLRRILRTKPRPASRGTSSHGFGRRAWPRDGCKLVPTVTGDGVVEAHLRDQSSCHPERSEGSHGDRDQCSD